VRRAVRHMLNRRFGHTICGRDEVWRVVQDWKDVTCQRCQKIAQRQQEPSVVEQKPATTSKDTASR